MDALARQIASYVLAVHCLENCIHALECICTEMFCIVVKSLRPINQGLEYVAHHIVSRHFQWVRSQG